MAEQSVRRLKTNLKNAGSIGSEDSTQDNAFMFSVIQSGQLNERDCGTYFYGGTEYQNYSVARYFNH